LADRERGCSAVARGTRASAKKKPPEAGGFIYVAERTTAAIELHNTSRGIKKLVF
jgi:hypothetical protein